MRVGCRILLALGLVLLLQSASLRAQEVQPGEGRPRVERIRFEGIDALEAGELRGAIVTEQSRCRSFLLRPVCWLTDWRVVVERNYLTWDELPRDELRLDVFYFRRGYREAAIASEVRPSRRGVEVVFRIEEGEPTLIETLEVTQLESVLRDGQIRRAGLPGEGQPLNLVQLDTALVSLATRLGERGYLDALLYDTVEVRPLERTARVEVVIEPKRRSTVGEVEIRGNEQITDRTITNALRLRDGRVLRTSDIVASQRSLYESNLFHEARVTVPEQPDSAKRIEIEVREAPPRGARIGGGFNTFEFFQTEARFTHYNLLGGGRRLDLRGTVGNLLAPQLTGRGIFRDVLPPGITRDDESPFLKPTWLASADLIQPSFLAAPNRLGFGVFAHRRTIPGIVVDQGFGADLSLTRQLERRAPATLNYRFELSSVEAGDLYFCVNYGICQPTTIEAVRSRHSLSPLGLSFFTDRSNDPLGPTTGYRTRVDIEHASAVTFSDFRYHRISGDATYYHPFGVQRRHVLAGRIRAGWVHPLGGTARALGIDAEEEALLHPRKRFYSGGSRSVRGYGENQLGPRVLTIDPAALRGQRVVNGDTIYVLCPLDTPLAACDPNRTAVVDDETVGVPVDDFVPRPNGGTTVLEGNLEYRFPVWRGFQGAVFLDGAIVGERLGGLFSDGIGAVTPGFGARMRTPVGPVRVDLGIRPGITEELPVFTEVVDEDGQRHLVRLQTPRHYDPLEDRGGFLRQVLTRLTLHLSIGEAF
jgi:outer membrane protein insertion porin family